ncbi:MAG TPA: TonB-dependent receptor [Elusimicrobiota bacterium]|nr:TonB-dependent receptor [Elusimicrobiota bacterium]
MPDTPTEKHPSPRTGPRSWRLLLAVLLGLLHAGSARLLADEPAGPWTIGGRVLEKKYGRPLAGARLFVEENKSQRAAADAQGAFCLEVPGPGRYHLAVLHEDLQNAPPDVVVVSPEQPRVTVVLQREIRPPALPDIVVTAERHKDKTSKRVITGEELSNVAGSAGDPIKALQALPGITSGNDSSGDPAIRGSAPHDNLYYVDGMPVGYLFHMGDFYSIFNGDLVEDFSIFPSAFGPEYRSANGAVIDVALREPRRDKFVTTLNVSTLESDVLFEGPTAKDQAFYLGARRSYLDLLLPKTGSLDSGIDYVQFPKFYDYQGKYVWRLSSRNTLSLMGSGAEDESSLKIREDSDIAAHDPALAGDFSSLVRYHSQGISLTSLITPALTNKLIVGGLLTGFDLQAPIGYVRLNFHDLFVNEQLTITPDDAHEISLGGEFFNEAGSISADIKYEASSDFDPGRTDFTSASRKTYRKNLYSNAYAVHAKDRWQLFPVLMLGIGGRASYDDYLGGLYLEPWLGSEYNLTEKTLLTAAWGRYHQTPEGEEMVDVFGNEDLTHIRSEHTVAGIGQTLDHGWGWKLDVYYKELRELVVPDDTEIFVNRGRGTAKGAEFLLKKKQTTRWAGWVSFSQAESTRRNDLTGQEINFKYDQPSLANLVGQYDLTEKWTLSGHWRYHSGSPYTPIVGRTYDGVRYHPVYAEVNSARFPDYHRLDIRLAYHSRKDKRLDSWTVYFDIINAYNQRNIGGYSYNADYSSKKAVHQLPFMPAFGFTMRF